MNITILYRPNTDHQRAVLDFERNFNRQTGRDIDLLSLDTRDGADMARLYDIMQYPAIVARADDGVLQKVWQGEQLPLINEVLFYARENKAV